jgi:hypothetical protein
VSIAVLVHFQYVLPDDRCVVGAVSNAETLQPCENGVPISRYMLHHLMQTYGAVAGLLSEKRKDTVGQPPSAEI